MRGSPLRVSIRTTYNKLHEVGKVTIKSNSTCRILDKSNASANRDVIIDWKLVNSLVGTPDRSAPSDDSTPPLPDAELAPNLKLRIMVGRLVLKIFTAASTTTLTGPDMVESTSVTGLNTRAMSSALFPRGKSTGDCEASTGYTLLGNDTLHVTSTTDRSKSNMLGSPGSVIRENGMLCPGEISEAVPSVWAICSEEMRT